MAEPHIENFHAHIYFDPGEMDRAQALAGAAQKRFGVPVGISTSGRSGPIRAGRCR